MFLSSNIAFAQQSDKVYLTADEVPNAVYWLPSPPAPGSSQFMYDISQYYWGKHQRLDTLRDTLLPKLMSGQIKVGDVK